MAASVHWLHGEQSEDAAPVRQAREACYALRSFIENDPRWTQHRLRWDHVVVFPNSSLAKDFALPDCPRWKVIDTEQSSHRTTSPHPRHSTTVASDLVIAATDEESACQDVKQIQLGTSAPVNPPHISSLNKAERESSRRGWAEPVAGLLLTVCECGRNVGVGAKPPSGAFRYSKRRASASSASRTRRSTIAPAGCTSHIAAYTAPAIFSRS